MAACDISSFERASSDAALHVAGGTRLRTGGRYDPVDDLWTPTSTVGAPLMSTANDYWPVRPSLWTGRVMLVHGLDPTSWAGGRTGAYDPVLDQWSAVSSTGEPTNDTIVLGVWTGAQLLLWRAIPDAPQARYDVQLDLWRPIAANTWPITGNGATAVWTGRKMLVWRGTRTGAPTSIGAGAAYVP